MSSYPEHDDDVGMTIFLIMIPVALMALIVLLALIWGI